jgi:hypothetical protein
VAVFGAWLSVSLFFPATVPVCDRHIHYGSPAHQQLHPYVECRSQKLYCQTHTFYAHFANTAQVVVQGIVVLAVGFRSSGSLFGILAHHQPAQAVVPELAYTAIGAFLLHYAGATACTYGLPGIAGGKIKSAKNRLIFLGLSAVSLFSTIARAVRL